MLKMLKYLFIKHIPSSDPVVTYMVSVHLDTHGKYRYILTRFMTQLQIMEKPGRVRLLDTVHVKSY